MALRIAQLEEIQALLLTSPALVAGFESRAPGFVEDANAWLLEAERVLESNRLAVVSQVAQVRATIASARRGIRSPAIEVAGRPTRRKLAAAAALRALGDASDLIHGAIARRQVEVEEAEKVVRQIVAVAQAKGLLEPSLANGSHHGGLVQLRTAISSDPDLMPYHVALLGSVTPDDALVLLDRARHALLTQGGAA